MLRNSMQSSVLTKENIGKTENSDAVTEERNDCRNN